MILVSETKGYTNTALPVVDVPVANKIASVTLPEAVADLLNVTLSPKEILPVLVKAKV